MFRISFVIYYYYYIVYRLQGFSTDTRFSSLVQLLIVSGSAAQHSEACIKLSCSGSIATNGRLWPNIAPKIRYQGTGSTS